MNIRTKLRKAWRRRAKRESLKWVTGEPIYWQVIEMELPDLDHGCSPECACLVKKETDHDSDYDS